jgi:alanine racemase
MRDVPMRCWIEVSLARIAANYDALRQAVNGEAEVMAVVKADAYRHGAVEVSRTLEGRGARWLAVSSVEEGVTLREAGIGVRILVMADFLPGEREALLDYGLTPVIHTLDDVAAWEALAEARGVERAAYHLKIDSGMGRLGTRAGAEEIAAVIRRTRRARLEGLMTHFASAANYESTQTAEQIARFEQVRRGLADAGIVPEFVHLASSIPVAYARREAWGKMVRPGHAVYGYVSPLVRGVGPPKLLKVSPALSWKASIVAVKDLPAGARVGYGGMYRTPAPMRIGVLAAGYADGIPHRLSDRGRVIAGGKYAAILGAVSMDLTTIDLTQAPHLKPGDAVTLLGEEGDARIDAQQIARTAGTISYSVLCGISARVKRVYV